MRQRGPVDGRECWKAAGRLRIIVPHAPDRLGRSALRAESEHQKEKPSPDSKHKSLRTISDIGLDTVLIARMGVVPRFNLSRLGPQIVAHVSILPKWPHL